MAAWARRIANLSGAVVTALAVVLVLGAGYGPVPALGRALVPGGGVWASAAADPATRDETLRLPGLSRPAKVSFTAEGLASIDAATDADLFLVQGYVTARFRLVQMDLERRAGRGRLAELNGAAALDTDRLELRLGLLRSAEAEWAATRRDGAAGRALLSYARGVNAWLERLERTGQWPVIYGLTGVRPARWTPVDSLVVQKIFNQQMDFSTSPLTYELLRGSLGEDLTMRWFPERAVTRSQPFAPGPYRALPPEPMPSPNFNAARPEGAPAAPAPAPVPAAPAASSAPAAAAILKDLRGIPFGGSQQRFNSNAWAVNGPAAGGGRSMLAGDPHTALTLPSSWFEVSLRSPGYRVSGGTLPGLPAVVLGRNEHISWSLTNASNQATFFYKEQTSPARPGSYYWRGAWRRMETDRHTIPVRGSGSVRLDVDRTVHGPVMTLKGQTVSVTWMGNYRSDDLTAILGVNRARDHAGFRAALKSWRAPAMNFVYADDQGTIAALSPGYYPQFPEGTRPWFPMSGTGSEEITGTVPIDAVPQVVDPKGHVIASTNQRPVGDDYPYYIGTSANFDPGHRQAVILDSLRRHPATTAADSAVLQNDVTDGLAGQLVPALLKALDGASLNDRERAASRLLAGWDRSMDAGSAAASIWWTFFDTYLPAVFEPWWDAKKVPVHDDEFGLNLEHLQIPLREALQKWTLDDPGNAAFTPPGGARRDAPQVMRESFTRAVAELAGKLGPAPSAWTWGRLHGREIPSITGAAGLGYGPYPDGGDPWTVNAAGGGMSSDFGPSRRMITRWGGASGTVAMAIYPGGQSEDPLSPWYRNLIPAWRAQRYLPMGPVGDAQAGAPGGATWTMRPGA
ncbi:penicillin acylase family protein [Actinomadura sp. GTD37]|uniref:penicillin acylase family protein n=1 Tax=Actinomadura sp. GTD37 TaxID=1778030 RepID=UPI0035BF5E25